jgi:hypothetical protein
MKRQYLLGILTLIAGLSGFCGLVYQVVWHKTAEYLKNGARLPARFMHPFNCSSAYSAS